MNDYHIENARTEAQAAKMLRLFSEGDCLFCLDTSEAWSVIHRTTHWRVGWNDFPYEGARLHLLLSPTTHAQDLLDLSRDALNDLWDALRWVHSHFELKYYSIGVRCGDCRATGGTIAHVHVHVVVGDVENVAHEPVRFKMSSRL